VAETARFGPPPLKVCPKPSPERVPAVPWHVSRLKNCLRMRWYRLFRSIVFFSVLVKIGYLRKSLRGVRSKLTMHGLLTVQIHAQ
jgi:hypothetical protein